MNIYLAGPMSGIKEFNFPAFNAVSAKLRAEGHSVFNPAERDIERHNGVDISQGNETGSQEFAAEKYGFSLRDALADDTWYICKEADAIAMLPGWENSKGARAEWTLSVALGLTIIYLDHDAN